MIYDFDKPIERLGTDCEKWDGLKKRFGSDGMLPLWVADMDFPSPEPVVRAIAERAAHPVFGYPMRVAKTITTASSPGKRSAGTGT